VRWCVCGRKNVATPSSTPPLSYLFRNTSQPPFSLLLPRSRYPVSHVYNVVSDVSSYQEFVPWCVDSVVLRRSPSPQTYMEAELAVGFQLFAERYVSRVTLDPGKMVTARASDTQLFHHLVNEWTFAPGPPADEGGGAESGSGGEFPLAVPAPVGGGGGGGGGTTWLGFRVDFQFRSLLYAQASHLFFDEVVSKMVAAFERRCALVWEREEGPRRELLELERRRAEGEARARAVAAARPVLVLAAGPAAFAADGGGAGAEEAQAAQAASLSSATTSASSAAAAAAAAHVRASTAAALAEQHRQEQERAAEELAGKRKGAAAPPAAARGLPERTTRGRPPPPLPLSSAIW
jgi:coenzyme Q-binding protein COQ10